MNLKKMFIFKLRIVVLQADFDSLNRMQSVDGKFAVRELRASVMALIPKLLSILGNMATTDVVFE